MFQKALLLADRANVDRALETLSAILADEVSPVLRVRALVVLGELLVDEDPTAAATHLSEALAFADEIPDADDVLGVELGRARELVRLIASHRP